MTFFVNFMSNDYTAPPAVRWTRTENVGEVDLIGITKDADISTSKQFVSIDYYGVPLVHQGTAHQGYRTKLKLYLEKESDFTTYKIRL